MKKIVDFLKFTWKERPRIVLLVGGGALLCAFLLMGGEDSVVLEAPQKISKPKMEGLQAAVDPRDVWVDGISREMRELEERVGGTRSKESEEMRQALEDLGKEVLALKAQRDHQVQTKQTATEPQVRVVNKEPEEAPPQTKRMVHLHQTVARKTGNEKDPKNYVPSTAHARAVLLTGIVAETGTESAAEPQPILMRLVDNSLFSKWDKNVQIKDAVLIGSCHGHLSSERAKCRLEKISLTNSKGEIVERPVEGWLIGEDGRPGLLGEVIDKSGAVTRMAMLNGILGGVASFFQNQASSSVFPVSPISGASKALTGMGAMKAGAASGVGSALQKLADYAIKRAEQMNPVIVVDSGRVIDIVFNKGFNLTDASSAEVAAAAPPKGVRTQSGSPQFSGAGVAGTREGGWNDATASMKNLAMGREFGAEGTF